VLGPDQPRNRHSAQHTSPCYYRTQRRFAEAEVLLKRSLAIYEKAIGPDHPFRVGVGLNNLALLYRSQSRRAEVEQLYKRSLAIAR
jgi:hypothetical protein